MEDGKEEEARLRSEHMLCYMVRLQTVTQQKIDAPDQLQTDSC